MKMLSATAIGSCREPGVVGKGVYTHDGRVQKKGQEQRCNALALTTTLALTAHLACTLLDPPPVIQDYQHCTALL